MLTVAEICPRGCRLGPDPSRFGPRVPSVAAVVVIAAAAAHDTTAGSPWLVLRVVACIKGALAANRGEYYRYPMTFRLLAGPADLG